MKQILCLLLLSSLLACTTEVISTENPIEITVDDIIDNWLHQNLSTGEMIVELDNRGLEVVSTENRGKVVFNSNIELDSHFKQVLSVKYSKKSSGDYEVWYPMSDSLRFRRIEFQPMPWGEVEIVCWE